jgi:hypothetical protein
MKSIELTLP